VWSYTRFNVGRSEVERDALTVDTYVHWLSFFRADASFPDCRPASALAGAGFPIKSTARGELGAVFSQIYASG
jgi:hypothetical protein